MSLDKAFYVNPINVNGSTFQLDIAESNHATRVLRLKKGDEICLLNGVGIGYHAKIKSIETNVCDPIALGISLNSLIVLLFTDIIISPTLIPL